MAKKSVSAKWRKLFKLIPGYDPIKTAHPGMWFDEETADLAIRFFCEKLKHVEGELAGQPFVPADWQIAHIGCAFGWKLANGLRRYREVFDFEPRKNGKSTKCAGLVNLVAFCDNEPGAQIYSAAAEREQAALVFRQAKGMILQDDELDRATKIYATYKSIEYPGNVIYKALSADADTKHGFNSHFIIIDELHAQPNRDLVDVLATSTGSRRQPMVWMITTSDFHRPSICNDKYDYACKVRDGIIDDPSFLPIIFEARLEDDWKDPKVWRKANPNIGESVSEEYLARECQRAIDQPSYENTFKRLHLNIRTEQDVRWLQMDKWDACDGEVPAEQLIGASCFAGLDLSSTKDLTAFVLYFPDTGALLPHFWIPEMNAHAREQRDRVPYMTWANQGFITLTPGNVVDYRVIREEIRALCERYTIQRIGYDPWNATQVALEMQDEDGLPMFEFRQGTVSMNEPCKRLEALMLKGQLKHGGNPVLRWNASNASVKSDASGNIRIDKQKSTEKVDGLVALAMAIGCWMAGDGNATSIYEERGIVFV